jgi:deferrochelatase/peroxidase EfeB
MPNSHSTGGAETAAPPEYNPALDDIQGLILRGYNYRYIRYIILKINDAAGARSLCAKFLPKSGSPLTLTTAAPWVVRPQYCLSLGITSAGLIKLIGEDNCAKVATASPDLFSIFGPGVTEPGNLTAIGDTDSSSPRYWWSRSGGWLNPKIPPTPSGEELHLQVTLYLNEPEDREVYYKTLLEMIPGYDTSNPSAEPVFFMDSDPVKVGEDLDYIHFGYKDSISQPRVGDVPWNKKEFRLAMGVSTIDDRPIVDADHFAISLNSTKYSAHPLLSHGSFAAFRLLYQDVKAFEDFIGKNPDPELVAAKMCGRWFDGKPLVLSPDGKPIPLPGGGVVSTAEEDIKQDFTLTNFNYLRPTPNQLGPREEDDLGKLCPYAAHIRRTNPRDDNKVTGNEDINGLPNYAMIHRVMRRATPYGPVYVKGETPGIQRGLVGLFLGANLTDQFQFIMSQWMETGYFRPSEDTYNSSGVDPLFGQQPSDQDPNHQYFEYYSDPGGNDPPYQDIQGLSRFIRTDGSLYLFLPGIAALKCISENILPG